jgi:hypothetical protein
VAETMGASQTSTAEGIPLTAGMPTTLETPTIVLASTGRPTATEMPQTVWMLTTNEFLWKFAKKLSELLKFMKKDAKEQKLLIFSSIDFSQSDRYQTIGSPLLLV